MAEGVHCTKRNLDPSVTSCILVLRKLDAGGPSLPPWWTLVQRAGLLVAFFRYHSNPLRETHPGPANSFPPLGVLWCLTFPQRLK